MNAKTYNLSIFIQRLFIYFNYVIPLITIIMTAIWLADGIGKDTAQSSL